MASCRSPRRPNQMMSSAGDDARRTLAPAVSRAWSMKGLKPVLPLGVSRASASADGSCRVSARVGSPGGVCHKQVHFQAEHRVTKSTRCAAMSDMRRPRHEGQKPRRLRPGQRLCTSTTRANTANGPVTRCSSQATCRRKRDIVQKEVPHTLRSLALYVRRQALDPCLEARLHVLRPRRYLVRTGSNLFW